jgi:nucleoside-diphosphate-sugar epimerase
VSERVLIAGAGYVGGALAADLAAAGHEVITVRRTPSAGGVGHAVTADLANPGALAALPGHIDAVVYTAAPDGHDEAAYQRAYVDGLARTLDALAARRDPVRRLILTSSTSVYGQDDGAVVDEDSETVPRTATGRLVLEAERLAASGPFPATVVRLGGIYGPGRTSLIDRVRRGSPGCARGTPVYRNRIHRDDCVGCLRYVLDHRSPPDRLLGVDEAPTDLCETLDWLADRLGVPRLPDEPSPLGPRAEGNKRADSGRLRALGYRFRYPTYREGYAALLG